MKNCNFINDPTSIVVATETLVISDIQTTFSIITPKYGVKHFQ